MKMNADVKEKWVAALRSGDYKQGSGVLRDTDGSFCCLGVLCEVAVSEGIVSPHEEDVNGYLVYAGAGVYLPNVVSDWADVPIMGEISVENGDPVSLPSLNDTQVPFSKIADFIEENM